MKSLEEHTLLMHSGSADQNLGQKILEGNFSDFLIKVDAFDPSKSTCVECAYFAKGKLLLIFFDLAPTPYYQSQLLDRLVGVLSASPLQSDWRVLWLFQVKLLLNFSRSLTKDQSAQLDILKGRGDFIPMLPSSGDPQILSRMKQSNNYSMYMFASADKVLQNKYFAPFLK